MLNHERIINLSQSTRFSRINGYLSGRKEKEYYKILEQSDDETEMFRAQGACSLLNRMKSMKVEVQTKAKRG